MSVRESATAFTRMSGANSALRDFVNPSTAPFAAEIALFSLTYGGMVHSFYPYIVPKKITINDAASAPESLFIILIGTLFVLPAILGYTILSYYIFRHKATALRYD